MLKRAWSVENDDIHPSTGLLTQPTVSKVQQVQGSKVAEVCSTIVGDDVPEDVKRRLQATVLEYQEVFASSMRDLSRMTLTECAIDEDSGWEERRRRERTGEASGSYKRDVGHRTGLVAEERLAGALGCGQW